MINIEIGNEVMDISIGKENKTLYRWELDGGDIWRSRLGSSPELNWCIRLSINIWISNNPGSPEADWLRKSVIPFLR